MQFRTVWPGTMPNDRPMDFLKNNSRPEWKGGRGEQEGQIVLGGTATDQPTLKDESWGAITTTEGGGREEKPFHIR